MDTRLGGDIFGVNKTIENPELAVESGVRDRRVVESADAQARVIYHLLAPGRLWDASLKGAVKCSGMN
jgi:hypothetical protein